MNLEVDFNNVTYLIWLIVSLTFIIFFRYLVFSLSYHFTFFKLLKNRFSSRFLHKKKLQAKQYKKEIYWSAISGCIFGAVAVVFYYLYVNDYTLIYNSFSNNSWWYIPISIVLFLFLQDTYYYWAHRWMHLPKVYKYFHLVHHKSIHTSVFTSFSFHPFETILQAAFFPLIVLILPIHLYAFLTVLALMTVSATINHAGVEVYPSGKFGNWFQKWIIGASHHDKHHTKFNYNYGLYFTFWDRLMKTEYENDSN
ncbi:MAG: sterol desaturase family protein [Flavobacteriaceae bacterium]|nr:sterol desaturase family protein [Flavobacteriaceae bacterium]